MEKYQNLIDFLESWNVISNYKFTWELVNGRIYIKNEITPRATSELYGMLYSMVKNYIYYLKEDKDSYDLILEVLAIS